MMIEKSRAPKKVSIAEHLWDVFEQMAEDMGTDREGLVNQAMFMFARLNGYLTPGQEASASSPRLSAVTGRPQFIEALEPESDPLVMPNAMEDGDTPAGGTKRPGLGVAAAAAGGAPTAGASGRGDSARRRRVEERVLETAAQLERQIKGRAERPSSPPPLLDENLDDEEINDDEIVDELMGEVQKKNLYLMTADGELDKVAKERFLIGRGKHCDFVVHSGKVSREHAVIVSEPDGYFIEDLGSSNGTWFQKQRLKRRQIEDGDEFFICSEKIKCVIR